MGRTYEKWLAPEGDTDADHERFAKAMMKCQNASGTCASDGFCHYDGDCFKAASDAVETEIEELEARLAALKSLRK
ncbi:hypothetical protein [Pelagibacterium lentulum]|uniref:Uncharacterized protein n=1 Tax=Pelagibacterium lentulum TaxID=2029865 RepID=A0A916RQ14_9HYPH|nr:hypothetical protein [Pelagibacterium lentulum]GGA64824.1 hypothetical protein GCM10011499_39100 [Pelagibacterium lentulum]